MSDVDLAFPQLADQDAHDVVLDITSPWFYAEGHFLTTLIPCYAIQYYNHQHGVTLPSNRDR